MGHSDSKLSIPELSADHQPLPQRFIISYKKSYKRVAVFIKEPDCEPSYAAFLGRDWDGDMIFHDGPNDEYPPLAGVQPDGRMNQDFAITLPGVSPKGSGSRKEMLRYTPKHKRELYCFSMEVGTGPSRQVERFEWRRSRGSEVKSLGRSSWGWKLVRVGVEIAGVPAPADTSKLPGYEAVDGWTSDGKEVVAVWADASKTSMMTIGEFEYRGSGATGELGALWRLMAATSSLCIWARTSQIGVSASTSSAAS
ncbi:hypothetical protein G7046_g3360 [Stylonectria norvegica]|nr:hypothetical protein G7046_g3360 [Stylonectria norvegica]